LIRLPNGVLLRGFRLVRRSGLPMPRRRTFAAGILPCAHSMSAALPHPACAGRQRRLPGHGAAPRSVPRSTGCQPVPLLRPHV